MVDSFNLDMVVAMTTVVLQLASALPLTSQRRRAFHALWSSIQSIDIDDANCITIEHTITFIEKRPQDNRQRNNQ